MAAPTGLLSIAGTLEMDHFPYRTPREALGLTVAMHMPLPRHSYVHCDCTCQSGRPAIPPTALPLPQHSDFVVDPPRLSAPGPVCTNQARRANPATVDATHPNGYNEPSYCLEPRNEPVGSFFGISAINNNASTLGPHHRHPDGQKHPLVCMSCKRLNAADLRWKKEELMLGVCKLCRAWAIQNLAVGNHCTCIPHRRPNIANNFEHPIDHLCEEHHRMIWFDIEANASAEKRWRQYMVRQ